METTKEFPGSTMRRLVNEDFDDETPECSAEGFRVLKDAIIGKSRWSVIHELIFSEPGQPDGEAWRTTYRVAATESQDEGPFEYADTVKAARVLLVEKAVKVWIHSETGKPLSLAVEQ